MRKPTKLLAIFISVCMVMTAMTACGKKNEDKGSSPDVTDKDEAPVSIEWKPQNGTAPVDADSPIVKEINSRFNVKLTIAYMDPSKEAELLNLRIASGQVPDVLYLGTAAALMQQYASDGVITEIPVDRFKKFAPELYRMTEKVGGSNVFEYYKIDGKLYGMPYLSPDGKYTYVPVWRNDWLKNVGIAKVPETLAEAEDAFYKFVKNDPDKNGKNDTYALSDKGFSAVFGAYGGLGGSFTWLKDGKGGVILSAVMPEMKAALTTLNKWYKDGLIDPEFISGENKGQYWANTLPFWNGKIGFSVPGTYYHVNPSLYEGDKGSGLYQNFTKLQPEGTYDTGKPLKGPDGKTGITRFSYMSGAGVLFGKNCAKDPKKMEKALQILEAEHTDIEFYKFLRFGRLGTEYDMVNGLPKVKEEITKEPATAPKLGIGLVTVLQLQNNHDYYRSTALHPKLVEYANKVAASTENYQNEVFVSLPSYAQYKANIEKKITENYALFISGQRPVAEFEKFVEELNKDGLTQLTKEANDWFKKYNK